ncbi:hypothetical protein ACQ3G6_12855 [Allorhizobium undicola]|uniref:hypothetical protein n=1 Tax=Allorhizobium undicola TaxID=78527 RepID=UPI003D346138
MRQIDIDSLDEATLIELNARIVERLQLLHHQRPRRPFKASEWAAVEFGRSWRSSGSWCRHPPQQEDADGAGR